MKVVYNSKFGGFSLSDEAIARLGGEDEAEKMARHDPRLVQVVEDMGAAADGSYARLRIHALKGRRYRIDEYDGYEGVQEPDDIEWIEVGLDL